METRNERIQRILANFSALNGAKFVGIREYISVKSGEVANFVINANFNYGNAVETTIAILKSLTTDHFTAIAETYKVGNEAGTKYATNKGAVEFLNSGKLPKEGTKARETVLKGVKETKTLATIRDEYVQSFLNNRDDETRSPQSIAQAKIYEPVTKGVKRHIESGKLHIYALSHSKEVLIEGEYAESTPEIETAQKIAIERYCKEVLKSQLPTTKYRNFVCEEGQLFEVVITGDTIQMI